MLVGYQEQREFHLPLESIYYADSADSKTFLYQEQAVYQCRETLAALEGKLCQTTLYVATLAVALVFHWAAATVQSIVFYPVPGCG